MKMDHSCVSTKYNWHMTHDNEILKKQKHACFRLQKWMYCCTTHLRNHHTTTKVVDSLYTCSQKPYLSENCIQSTINEKITQSRISMYCLQYFSEVVSLFLPPPSWDDPLTQDTCQRLCCHSHNPPLVRSDFHSHTQQIQNQNSIHPRTNDALNTLTR